MHHLAQMTPSQSQVAQPGVLIHDQATRLDKCTMYLNPSVPGHDETPTMSLSIAIEPSAAVHSSQHCANDYGQERAEVDGSTSQHAVHEDQSREKMRTRSDANTWISCLERFHAINSSQTVVGDALGFTVPRERITVMVIDAAIITVVTNAASG